jgi:predicted Rossmann-fold nucleotide-binding protein
VLFGSNYWRGMLDWLRDTVMPGGKISEHDMALFYLTDSPAEVVEIVTRSQSSLAELDSVSEDIRVAT